MVNNYLVNSTACQSLIRYNRWFTLGSRNPEEITTPRLFSPLKSKKINKAPRPSPRSCAIKPPSRVPNPNHLPDLISEYLRCHPLAKRPLSRS